MRWFVGGCALVLATLTVPTAQTPAQPARPLTPVDHAARAINEGRYDEVDAILKNESDPRVPGLRAQALIARGRYADAEALLKAPAAAAPTGDAALQLGLLQMLVGRRPDAQRVLRRVADGGTPRTAAEYARMAMASRALGEYKDANDLYRNATRLAPDDAVINTAWGELFLEKYDRPEALKSFQAALKVDPIVRAGAPRSGGRGRGRQSAGGEGGDRAGAQGQSQFGDGAGAAGRDGARRPQARRSAGGHRQGPQGQPAAASTRWRFAPRWTSCEGKLTDFETHAKEALADQPALRRRVSASPATMPRAITCSTRRWRSHARAIELDDANPTAHANLGMHLLRTGDEPAARRSLERAFKDDPYNVVTFNSLALLDSLDKFETIQDGDLIFRFHPDEVTVMREQAIPLAKEAFAALIKQLRLHAEGPDPDRDVPQARRLRRAHAGPAGHGRRAGRLLRPRGHAGFAQGASARRVPLGRNAVARAGARDDAADVEQPRAAVADRGHVGVGRAAGAPRVGP